MYKKLKSKDIGWIGEREKIISLLAYTFVFSLKPVAV